MLPEKTPQRTTQFFRSVLGDESAMSARRTPKDDDAEASPASMSTDRSTLARAYFIERRR
jgi:hypothetical protein